MELNYLRIMTESLEKKEDILKQIVELNRQQKFLLQDANLLPEEFEKNIQYKADLVEQLNLLDEGFEELFSKVREELQTNKQMYAKEIECMQELIRQITDLTNMIQTQEIRNKESATNKFTEIRKQVKGVRNSQKVVKQYYDNMMNHKTVMTQMIDNRK